MVLNGSQTKESKCNSADNRVCLADTTFVLPMCAAHAGGHVFQWRNEGASVPTFAKGRVFPLLLQDTPLVSFLSRLG